MLTWFENSCYLCFNINTITAPARAQNKKNMKAYKTYYRFEENKIGYVVKVIGHVFETANEEIEFNHVADLRKGLANEIINAVIWAISDDQNGIAINGKPVIILDAKLMQSNANNAYAVLVDGNLYPISVNVEIEVTSDPFELLK